ncbi:MAG TPA: response regulator [Gemmatimonadales bacterium]|nr:response regulator [Gemmatimonadales bacterium]
MFTKSRAIRRLTAMASVPEVASPQPTVLLVEDDESLRRMLARTLRCESFGVLEAENGQAALRVVREFGGSLSLALTDITMPVMDGLEFARLFRSLYPSVPVLFMSGAMPRSSQAIPVLEVGTHLLLKPFGPDVLIEAISALLNHEQRSAYRTTA